MTASRELTRHHDRTRTYPNRNEREQHANPFRNLRELVDFVAGKSLPTSDRRRGTRHRAVAVPIPGDRRSTGDEAGIAAWD